ncbi:MAG: hypothetical protein CL930_08470 [Deltaproteobacteria bacterium]|nr:hypothetical protein [Deltaproteobacteria bacterium]
MEFLLAGTVFLLELVCVTFVYISMVRPEKAPKFLADMPVIWRIVLVFSSSFAAGAIIQWARL